VTRIKQRLRAERACALQLVERVEHDQCTDFGRVAQQLVLLVVAVDHEPLAGDPCAEREFELADGRDVGAEALLRQELQHRDGRERFRAVNDQRAGRRLAIRPGLRPQRCVVVDDDRRSELARELGGLDATRARARRPRRGRYQGEDPTARQALCSCRCS